MLADYCNHYFINVRRKIYRLPKGLVKMSEPLRVRQSMSKKFCTIVIYIKNKILPQLVICLNTSYPHMMEHFTIPTDKPIKYKSRPKILKSKICIFLSVFLDRMCESTGMCMFRSCFVKKEKVTVLFFLMMKIQSELQFICRCQRS